MIIIIRRKKDKKIETPVKLIWNTFFAMEAINPRPVIHK